MTEGTISVLFGCHSVIHSLCVLRAWRYLYRRWPWGWQIVCIFLHDVGHWGRDYLSNPEEKEDHWYLGAKIARWLFGMKGWQLVKGHTKVSLGGKGQIYSVAIINNKLCGGTVPNENLYEWNNDTDAWVQKMSLLAKADKYSHLFAPMWWLRLVKRVEMKVGGADEWLAAVTESILLEDGKSPHELYLEIKGRENGQEERSEQI